MKFIKESKHWNKLYSFWALVFGPFVGYGVSYLTDIVKDGPVGIFQIVLLVIISAIGVGSRFIAQDNLE